MSELFPNVINIRHTHTHTRTYDVYRARVTFHCKLDKPDKLHGYRTPTRAYYGDDNRLENELFFIFLFFLRFLSPRNALYSPIPQVPTILAPT